MDLERRGYIVYVTVSSAEEEHIIRSQNTEDIRALSLDLAMVGQSLTLEAVHLLIDLCSRLRRLQSFIRPCLRFVL